VTALHCACGHCFDPEQLEGTVEELELRVREEELYYDYLTARIDQVRAATRAVSDRRTTNPTDRYHEALATEALETLRVAEIALGEQSGRVAAARNSVASARANGTASIRDRGSEQLRGGRQRDSSVTPRRARQGQSIAHITARQAAMNCPRCTATLAPGIRHCPLCGASVAEVGRYGFQPPGSPQPDAGR